MMNNYRLDELGFVGRGKSKHRPRNDASLYGGEYPFLQTADVKHSPFYITNYSQTYNEKGLKQSKLWDKGTLCITIAANIADTAILDFPACFPDSIVGFVPDPQLADVRYVKYCLDTYQKQMRLISQGTTQDNMSLEKIMSLKFRVPSLIIQKKIAALLISYDDLIATNNRRIQLLENMAEEVYKEWFVRLRFPEHENVKVVKGLPKGWEVASLTKLCSEVRKTIRKGDKEQGINYVGFEHLPQKSIAVRSSDDLYSLGSNKLEFIKGDILFGKIRPYLHKLCLSFDDGACSSDILVIRPNNKNVTAFLLLTMFSKDFIDIATISATGTKMPRADWKFLSKLEFKLPSQELLNQFQDHTESMFAEIDYLLKTNQNLAETRDKLLPRLISGKLSVENLNIKFPPSMEEALA